MPRLELKSKIEKIIYVKLKAGDDILQAIWNISNQNNIKAGIVIQGSGVLENVVIKGFPRNSLTCKLPLDVYELKGPLMADIRGIIGVTVESDVDISEIPIEIVPDVVDTELDKWQMFGSQGGGNTPYFRGHFTFVNKDISQSGHLLPGTQVADLDSDIGIPSDYTLVIAKMKDIELHAKLGKNGMYHDIVKAQNC